jgi:amino acid permease
LIILFLGFAKFEEKNLTFFSLPHLSLPYGVILFSFLAFEAIPEASDILKEKKKLKWVIILSTLIVGLIYLLFALSVVGVSGENTSPEALEGLTPFLGKKIVIIGALAALITIADSFLILAICLSNTLTYDFKIPKFLSSLLTSFLPLILFFSGLRDFITVIGFVGTFIGLINGLAIILIYKKAKILGDREPEYSLNLPNFVFYLLALILIFGTISQIYYEIYR